MKKLAIVAALAALSCTAIAANTDMQTTTPATSQQTTMTKASLQSNTDKLSYTVGVEMGENFKNQGVQINPDALAAGLKDALSGKQLLMTKEEMKTTIQTFQKKLLAKRAAEFKALSEKNAQAGAAFLAKNKTQPGVKTLANGLQYKVITEGTGPKPTANDVVTVNYKGQFLDGTVFDSSYKRGKPAKFPVNEVIPGWQEALKMMPVGSTWEVYVPSKLAYGKQGMGRLIGPNETLIFKIELIKVDKKQS